MSAVTVEAKGAIPTIRINRPQHVAVALQRAFQAFDADDSRRVVARKPRFKAQ